MELAGSQAKAAVRAAAPRALPGAPSWGRVLATTVSLWTGRRVARLRHPRMALFLAICVVAAAAAVASVLQFTGTSPRTASPARPHQVRPAWALGAAGAVRTQAAAWVSGQVSSAETVGCDPLMCAALRAHGVAASRLLPMGPTASGAGVLVASLSAGDQQVAPVLLASFGSGASVVEVRTAPPGGSAAYQRVVQADLAARQSAGTQLLHSRRIGVGAVAAGQLQAGEVDTRLLIMLAMLASQHPWQVVAFGGGSPGVPLAQAPFRQVTITGPDAGALAASLALVRAQRTPYQPAQAVIVRLPGGQAAQGQLALRIDFAAPSPPGLLTGGASG
ncbi:MAG TPA: hypothetical protein VMK84_24655 [Streptosporangiaceae bacterium]|nr:hypothetical protein [Streptosporangiaceae bacterium]